MLVISSGVCITQRQDPTIRDLASQGTSSSTTIFQPPSLRTQWLEHSSVSKENQRTSLASSLELTGWLQMGTRQTKLARMV